MIAYTGPATVVDHHGGGYEVRAHLTSTKVGALTRWLGTLRGSAPWLDMIGATCTLRVGTREAPFAVHELDGDDGPTSIEGSGPPTVRKLSAYYVHQLPQPWRVMHDEQKPEQDQPVSKRSMRDRSLQKGASPEPSKDHASEDEPGAAAEADQRAIEDEFWNKK